MNKPSILLSLLPTLALMLLASPLLHAQAKGTQANIGPVNLDWQRGQFAGNHLLLSGGVHMTSANYDLQSLTLSVDLQPGRRAPGSLGIARATADGDPKTGTPVTGRFQSPLQHRTYFVTGDHAVYVPEAGRPGGGRIDFTGHVVITLQAPQNLSGPAVTKLEHAVVHLGAGPDYPQVEFGKGTLVFTPLQ